MKYKRNKKQKNKKKEVKEGKKRIGTTPYPKKSIDESVQA